MAQLYTCSVYMDIEKKALPLSCVLCRVQVCTEKWTELYSWNEDTSFNQDTMNGPSYIEKCTKLLPWNEDTFLNQDTLSCPSCTEKSSIHVPQNYFPETRTRVSLIHGTLYNQEIPAVFRGHSLFLHCGDKAPCWVWTRPSQCYLPHVQYVQAAVVNATIRTRSTTS